MVFNNVDSINRKVNEIGLNIKIIHFSNDIEYDDDQNLINPSEKINTVALITNPSYKDVEQSGNLSKITYKDKKLRVMENIDVSIGDEVYIDGEDTKYYVIDFSHSNVSISTSKVFFISKNK